MNSGSSKLNGLARNGASAAMTRNVSAQWGCSANHRRILPDKLLSAGWLASVIGWILMDSPATRNIFRRSGQPEVWTVLISERNSISPGFRPAARAHCHWFSSGLIFQNINGHAFGRHLAKGEGQWS